MENTFLWTACVVGCQGHRVCTFLSLCAVGFIMIWYVRLKWSTTFSVQNLWKAGHCSRSCIPLWGPCVQQWSRSWLQCLGGSSHGSVEQWAPGAFRTVGRKDLCLWMKCPVLGQRLWGSGKPCGCMDHTNIKKTNETQKPKHACFLEKGW